MTEKRKPWMKFYPGDWQADEGLVQCSLAARGLWIEMIAVMHKSDRYGYLLVAGQKPTVLEIAKQVKSDPKDVAKHLSELEKWRVFSRTEDGIIYSRRMIADDKKAKQDAENGRGGGNPRLKKSHPINSLDGVNPPDNRADNQPVIAEDKGGDKAQRLEARGQKEEEPPSPIGDVTPSLPDAPPADPPAKPKRAQQVPPDWRPSDADRNFAACHIAPGDLDQQVEQFRDHHRAKGNTFRDLSAAWRTWCRNHSRWKAQRKAAPAPRQSNMAWMLPPEPDDGSPIIDQQGMTIQ